MTFSKQFEARYVSQDYYENRTVEQTLDLGWELLSMFENVELKRIDIKLIEKYMPRFRRAPRKQKNNELKARKNGHLCCASRFQGK
jgi:vacuolar-type H+-ATPase subunit B/Vma2